MKTTTKPSAPKPDKGSAPGKPAGERIYNFSPGPAVLPEEVLRQAGADLWNIAGSGIGILEHSHRGPVFNKIIEEAEADCRKLGGVSDDYYVLFLQGGASLQFAMVPMNFLPADKTADYLDTGVWTSKAIKEAKLFGKVNLAFEGKTTNYDHVPAAAEIKLKPDAPYTWYCSNNTIYGTQFNGTPVTRTPLVCDASSDMYSRPIEVAKHALIFAGAQKNLGPAGCTLVIIRKDFAAKGKANLPAMLDYRQQAQEGSRFNTPPCFAIYIMGQVFKWALRQGGLEAIAKKNDEKAKIIYDAIDGSSGFYKGVARRDSRSRMNVTFKTPSETLDERFAEEAERVGLSGLKGHRSAGGIRASIYNAFPREGCAVLAAFMKEFAAREG